MRTIISLTLLMTSLNVLGAPCKGAQGSIHVNLNGTLGGFVSSTASVDKSVVIDSSSVVCERAKVLGKVKVVVGSEVSGDAEINGSAEIKSSKILGKAKVSSSSIVTGSKICQTSIINFNVINSDYYCQTDDEEPSNPGEIGKKTLVGVDSNLNGLRDDLEIWINDNTSNTPKKNLGNIRITLKQIGRSIQKAIIYKENQNECREAAVEIINGFACLKNLLTLSSYNELSGSMRVQAYNTYERLNAWAKSEGNLNGFVSKKNNSHKSCEYLGN